MKKLLLVCLALTLVACAVPQEKSSQPDATGTSAVQEDSSSSNVPNEESSATPSSGELGESSEAAPNTEFWSDLVQMTYTDEKLAGVTISHTPDCYYEDINYYDDGTTTFALGEEALFPLYYLYNDTGSNDNIYEEVMTTANGSQNWVRIYSTGRFSDVDWERCAYGTKRLSDLLKSTYDGSGGFWAQNKYGDILIDWNTAYKYGNNHTPTIRVNQKPIQRTSLQTFLTSNTQFQKEFLEKVGDVEDIELLVMNDMYLCG